jgi:hypothetical protein
MVSAATVCGMVKRMTGAGVNRSAARKAAEVAALRKARQQEYEAAVTQAVAVFFDRSWAAATVRADARDQAARILADAEQAAAELDGAADEAVATLKRLGEPVQRIAEMIELPVAGVRCALARADDRPPRAPAGAQAGPAANHGVAAADDGEHGVASAARSQPVDADIPDVSAGKT